METMNNPDRKKIWNANHIIEQADNWSLSGDVTILNSLKAFSSNLLSKTEQLDEKIDKLLNNLDEVGLSLDIAQNEFHSLRNTQFIENRVYEDDETLDSNVEEKVDEKPPVELEKSIFDAVIMGMSILDNYYEAVEVTLSDSEDESEKSFVLRPKDMYAQRALPPIIGTDEWYKKWNVEGSSSGSETDKVSERYSESDSEDNLPKDLLKESETSSELDFVSQTSDNRPVANSTFNDSVKKLDSATSSDVSDTEETKPTVSNRTFAEELTAKLDNVINKSDNQRNNTEQIKNSSVLDKEEEINKKPIKPVGSYTYGNIGGNLFSSEPPPLTDPPKIETDLFSGGQGLFDEKDDLLWDNLKNDTSKKRHQHDPKDVEKSGIPEKISFLPKSSQVSRGLFDSEDSSDDDDFFGFDKRKLAKPQFLQPNKPPIVPLFDEEPPEFTTRIDNKNTGGDLSISKSSDLFGNEGLKNTAPVEKRPSLFDEAGSLQKKEKSNHKVDLFDDGFDTNSNIAFPKTKASSKSENTLEKGSIEEPPSLFDEADIFQANQKSKSKVSIFDDSFDKKTNRPSSKQTLSLFDDDDDDDDLFKDNLFSDVTPKKHTSNLFDDLENSNLLSNDNVNTIETQNKEDEYQNDINSNNTSTTLSDEKNEIPTTIPKSEAAINHSVVSEETKHNTDLNTNETSEHFIEETKSMPIETSPNNGNASSPDEAGKIENIPASAQNGKDSTSNDIFGSSNYYGVIEKESETEKSVPRIGLFDSTPPPDDDDDWDTKSDNFSYTEDFTPYPMDERLNPSNVFDDEPPSLDADQSSGIVRDQNLTRVDTDDSSFYPHASSSRRLSSDIFSDQQSQDSFFVTKSRTDSITVPSNLGIIPENSNSRNEISENSPNQEATEGASVFNNIFDTKNSPSPENIFDDLANAPSIAERIKNIDVKESNTTGRTEVDGEVNLNKKNVSSDEPIKKTNISVITGSPGKLKHNLNINVNALIPGYVPPKTKEITKPLHIDSIAEIKNKEESKSLDNFRLDTSAEDSLNGNITKSVSFEENETVEVLSSITKDRAKIPIKRRPSTRRGRQEAIRKSVIDNSLDHDNDQQEVEQKNNAEVSNVIASIENNNVRMSENNIDEKRIQNSSSTSTTDPFNRTKKLFGSESESDDDLFLSKKSERNLKKPKPNKSLFEDSSSDDDLFKTTKPQQKENKTDRLIENKNKKSVIMKKMDKPSEDPLSDLLK